VSYDGFGLKLQGKKLPGSFGEMQMMFKKIGQEIEAAGIARFIDSTADLHF
jgi:hypothetical protein